LIITPGKSQRLVSRLYRVILLPAFALVLLVVLWAAVIYQIRQERVAAHDDAVLHSQSLARTLAEHTDNVLRQADHATQLFKLQFEATGGAMRLAEFTRSGGLLDSVLPSRLNLPIAVLGPDGAVIDNSHAWLPDRQADAPYFRQHADNGGDAPLYGTPVTEAQTHKWLIRVSRRLNDREGRFAGVVVMLVDPLVFVDDYDSLNVYDDGALLLLSHATGLTVGRLGDTLVMTDKIDFIAPSGRGHLPDEVVLREPIDGIGRIYSAREVPRYGLQAVIGMAHPWSIAKFERHRSIYFGTVSAITVLIIGFVALLMRQSQRLQRSMLEAREAQSMLRAAANGSLDGVLLLRAWRPPGRDRHAAIEDFVIADLNQRAADMIGLPREQIVGQKMCELQPYFRQAVFFDKYVRVLQTGLTEEDEFAPELPDGARVWLHHQVVAIDDGVAVTSRDITARKQAELEQRNAEHALQESEARLRTIADTVPTMIAYVDADEVYRFHNIAYEREFGRFDLQIQGRHMREVVGEAHYAALRPYIARVMAGENLRFEEEDKEDCGTRCMEVNYIPQYGKDGKDGKDGEIVIGFHIMRQDITMQKREKQRLLKLSQVDALTGLTNRAGFLEKLGEAMMTSRENGGMMAVMYMDIDRFKPVNDTHGHSVGDALLKAFSARLTHNMRASDTIARLGGDEFTIVMEKVGKQEDATMRAARIVAAMQAPFDLDGIKVGVSVSIGLAFYRGEDVNAAVLLKQADILLYRAKQGGRNTYRAATLSEMAAGAVFETPL
jgi:diguanylate cyclase (GGDEF)-like protein/PAS domain S-box-containing protein